MTYYQNPFFEEFRGNWALGDRQHAIAFVCPSHSGRLQTSVISHPEPLGGAFDLSGNDADGNSRSILKVGVAIDPTLRQFATISVNVVGSNTASAMTPSQIIDNLNADGNFSSFFTASLSSQSSQSSGPPYKIAISAKLPATSVRFYVLNTGAETVLRFNAKAGVAELPSYFDRHTVANVNTYADGLGQLISLSPQDAGGSSNVDDAIINNAVNVKGITLGLSSTTVKADYLLLKGRSGIFNFQKVTVDGSDRITQIIQHPAGATTGDLGRKITYAYTGTNTHPDKITEVPYTLQSGDIVTP